VRQFDAGQALKGFQTWDQSCADVRPRSLGHQPSERVEEALTVEAAPFTTLEPALIRRSRWPMPITRRQLPVLRPVPAAAWPRWGRRFRQEVGGLLYLLDSRPFA